VYSKNEVPKDKNVSKTSCFSQFLTEEVKINRHVLIAVSWNLPTFPSNKIKISEKALRACKSDQVVVLIIILKNKTTGLCILRVTKTHTKKAAFYSECYLCFKNPMFLIMF
jgi:hypothetical protein